MKSAKNYYDEILKIHQENNMETYRYKLKILNVITQAQKEAVKETVKECAKNAKISGYYSEPNMSQGINLKRLKRIWKFERLHFKVEINVKVDKDSIIEVANELIKNL
ncbi:MAG: hypothetical protein PHD97_13145 [Bacteroidales bacterium]|jgi:hypothetical protein|nr:hypothetical protein [Bacteroidales bacterium]